MVSIAAAQIDPAHGLFFMTSSALRYDLLAEIHREHAVDQRRDRS